MLELVNAARAAVGVQPLAMNGLINDAADLHTKYQLEADLLTHTGAGGTNAYQRMVASGYGFSGSYAWGENVGWRSVTGTDSYQDEVSAIHNSLMNSTGHRANILNANFREIGIGIAAGEFQGWNAVAVTQKFAKSGSSVFLTGVAFDDRDGDRFYDVGEGLGSATITAVNSVTGATFSAATGAAGGYSLALPAGTYRYSFAGTGFATTTGTVTIGTSNVKLDWIDPATSTTTVAPPTSGLTLTGTAGADTLTGGSANDGLQGLAGNDTLNGGAGADRMAGGSGNDSYVVDNAGDTVTELSGEGIDIVRSSIAYDLPVNVENLTLTGTAAVNGTGNGLANVINGNAAANVIRGLAGNDKLYGLGGNDRIEGGDGTDFIQGGLGTDTLVGGAGVDSFDWNTAAEAGKGTARDVVLDFVRGTDKLDVAGIDANASTTSTNEAFSFIGSAAFSGAAGQLRFYDGGGFAVVQGDTNGDRVADFEVKLEGVTALASTDFWL